MLCRRLIKFERLLLMALLTSVAGVQATTLCPFHVPAKQTPKHAFIVSIEEAATSPIRKIPTPLIATRTPYIYIGFRSAQEKSVRASCFAAEFFPPQTWIYKPLQMHFDPHWSWGRLQMLHPCMQKHYLELLPNHKNPTWLHLGPNIGGLKGGGLSSSREGREDIRREEDNEAADKQVALLKNIQKVHERQTDAFRSSKTNFEKHSTCFFAQSIQTVPLPHLKTLVDQLRILDEVQLSIRATEKRFTKEKNQLERYFPAVVVAWERLLRKNPGFCCTNVTDARLIYLYHCTACSDITSVVIYGYFLPWGYQRQSIRPGRCSCGIPRGLLSHKEKIVFSGDVRLDIVYKTVRDKYRLFYQQQLTLPPTPTLPLPAIPSHSFSPQISHASHTLHTFRLAALQELIGQYEIIVQDNATHTSVALFQDALPLWKKELEWLQVEDQLGLTHFEDNPKNDFLQHLYSHEAGKTLPWRALLQETDQAAKEQKKWYKKINLLIRRKAQIEEDFDRIIAEFSAHRSNDRVKHDWFVALKNAHLFRLHTAHATHLVDWNQCHRQIDFLNEQVSLRQSRAHVAGLGLHLVSSTYVPMFVPLTEPIILWAKNYARNAGDFSAAYQDTYEQICSIEGLYIIGKSVLLQVSAPSIHQLAGNITGLAGSALAHYSPQLHAAIPDIGKEFISTFAQSTITNTIYRAFSSGSDALFTYCALPSQVAPGDTTAMPLVQFPQTALFSTQQNTPFASCLPALVGTSFVDSVQKTGAQYIGTKWGASFLTRNQGQMLQHSMAHFLLGGTTAAAKKHILYGPSGSGNESALPAMGTTFLHSGIATVFAERAAYASCRPHRPAIAPPHGALLGKLTGLAVAYNLAKNITDVQLAHESVGQAIDYNFALTATGEFVFIDHLLEDPASLARLKKCLPDTDSPTKNSRLADFFIDQHCIQEVALGDKKRFFLPLTNQTYANKTHAIDALLVQNPLLRVFLHGLQETGSTQFLQDRFWLQKEAKKQWRSPPLSNTNAFEQHLQHHELNRFLISHGCDSLPLHSGAAFLQVEKNQFAFGDNIEVREKAQEVLQDFYADEEGVGLLGNYLSLQYGKSLSEKYTSQPHWQLSPLPADFDRRLAGTTNALLQNVPYQNSLVALGHVQLYYNEVKKTVYEPKGPADSLVENRYVYGPATKRKAEKDRLFRLREDLRLHLGVQLADPSYWDIGKKGILSGFFAGCWSAGTALLLLISQGGVVCVYPPVAPYIGYSLLTLGVGQKIHEINQSIGIRNIPGKVCAYVSDTAAEIIYPDKRAFRISMEQGCDPEGYYLGKAEFWGSFVGIAVGGMVVRRVGRGVWRKSGNGKLELRQNKKSKIDHIFRNTIGHIKDTPANRQLLECVANDLECKKGLGIRDKVCYAKILPDGSQVWVYVKDNKIINGGINKIPYTFVTGRGFVDSKK